MGDGAGVGDKVAVGAGLGKPQPSSNPTLKLSIAMSLYQESPVVAEKRTCFVYHAACTLAVSHPTSVSVPPVLDQSVVHVLSKDDICSSASVPIELPYMW